MDRAGLTAKTSVEVDVGLKPYEEVLAGVAKITRAKHDALMAGLPAAAEWAQRQPDPYYDTEPAAPKPGPRTTSDDGNVIDAEVVPLETTVLSSPRANSGSCWSTCGASAAASRRRAGQS